jgi:hypothetical protein
MIAAVIPLTALGGCKVTTSGIDIGPAPSYLQTSRLPPPRAGDSVFVDAARARQSDASKDVAACAAAYEWNHIRAQLKSGQTPKRLGESPKECLRSEKLGDPFPKPIK